LHVERFDGIQRQERAPAESVSRDGSNVPKGALKGLNAGDCRRSLATA